MQFSWSFDTYLQTKVYFCKSTSRGSIGENVIVIVMTKKVDDKIPNANYSSFA
jgi:hypothetical protein